MRLVPNKKASGPLTPEQLATLAEASLSNAVALIAEARGLLVAGATARAYSIAILAGEEFGKSQLAAGAVGRVAETAGYWKSWWRDFYGHGPKLARAALNARMFLPTELVKGFSSTLERALKEQRRETGFYVDVVDGRPVSPVDAVDHGEAQAAIESFGAVIDGYAELFSGDGIAQAFVESHQAAQEMRSALNSRIVSRSGSNGSERPVSA